MKASMLVLFAIGGFVAAMIVRAVIRRASYRPSRIYRVAEATVIWLARDSFRSSANSIDTYKLIEDVLASGVQRVIIDLSALELGFHDDGVFAGLWGSILFCNEHSVHMKIVRPQDVVYHSFEFLQFLEGLDHAGYSLLADSVNDGIRSFEERGHCA